VPRICTICSHPQRDEIDRLLVAADASNLGISSLFGVSESALRRHKSRHMPAALARAHAAEVVANADDLLAHVGELHAKARDLLGKAETAGDLKTALQGVREARGCLELLGRLMGELQDGQTINVLILPEWVSIRSVLVESLALYPEARTAVAGALEGIGHAG
jgi:hypothetical protein